MENASKALIMAGSVLIALMVIGALILMFNNLSNYQETDTQTTREAQIVQFNNQYETYNRNDVRGSDLYSLLSKVVDYNRRKSNAATGTDEGQDIEYKPMEINVKFPTINQIETNWTFDNEIRLFNRELGLKNNILTIDDSKTATSFKVKIENELNDVETKYGKSGITNLANGISNLFLTEQNPSEDKKQTAVDLYNKNRRK